jgi:hypothetical protein
MGLSVFCHTTQRHYGVVKVSAVLLLVAERVPVVRGLVQVVQLLRICTRYVVAGTVLGIWNDVAGALTQVSVHVLGLVLLGP